MRVSCAQSTATRTRSATIGRRARGAARAAASSRKPYSPGSGACASEHHHGVLPERVEREVRREQRAERVAVGVLVRRDDEALVRPQRLDDRVPVTRRHRRLRPRAPARRSAASCGRRARPRDRRRTRSRGVRRSLQLAVECGLQHPGRRPRAPRGCAARCRSVPKTLTQTFAWSRSFVVSTAVTVTNPMRGSLSVGMRLGEHLLDRLVDAAHATAPLIAAHRPRDGRARARERRARRPARTASAPPRRAAAPPHSPRASRRRA